MAYSPEEIRSYFVRYLSPHGADEHYEITDIEGEIPRELCGTLYRNGPSQKQLPPEGAEALHLFDGDGLVQAIRFEDGKAAFQSSYVRTESFLAEEAEGRYCMSSAQIQADAPLEIPRIQPNTNVIRHADRVFALVENAPPFELDPKTLEPLGHYDFDGKLQGMSTTAHPKVDGRTGQFLIHGYQPIEPYLSLYTLEPDGSVSLAESFDAPWPSMLHDFAITESSVVFPLSPVYFDVAVLAEGGGFDQAIRWEVERGLKFGVRSRSSGGEIQWFDAPTPGFIFHPGNAYEEDGVLYMDACTYLDGKGLLEDLSSARRGEIGSGLEAVPFLYELDLVTGECRERQLSDRSVEFPRIDPRRVGYKNRWGYCAVERPDPVSAPDRTFTSVLKYDRTGGEAATHVLPPAHWTSEPVFTPLCEDAAEDEGFVLSVVYDAPNDRSCVSILDAQQIEAQPLARLWLRNRIPLGFHGNFCEGV